MTHPRPSASRALRLVLAGALLVGVGLRLSRLDHQSLWTDEGMSSIFARGSPAETVELLQRDFHPPAYFLLLGEWMDLLGSSDLSLRCFSALLSAMLLVALYGLGVTMGGPRLGVLSVLVASVATYQVYYAQEVRAYALLGLSATASQDCYLRWIRRPRFRTGAAYVAISALLMYTHYVGCFVLLAQNLHFAIVQLRDRRRGRLPGWLAAQGAVALLFAPWLPSFWTQLRHVQSGFWIEEPTLADLLQLPVTLLWYRASWWNTILAVAVFAVTLLGAGLVWRRARPSEPLAADRRAGLLLVLWVALVPAACFALSLAGTRIYHYRSMMVVAPGLYVALAWLVLWLGAGRLRIFAVLTLSLTLGLGTSGLAHHFGKIHKHNFRAAARSFSEQVVRPAQVLFEPVYFKAAFDHYVPSAYEHVTHEDIAAGKKLASPVLWCLLGKGQEQSSNMLRFLKSMGFEEGRREEFRALTLVRMERAFTR